MYIVPNYIAMNKHNILTTAQQAFKILDKMIFPDDISGYFLERSHRHLTQTRF